MYELDVISPLSSAIDVEHNALFKGLNPEQLAAVTLPAVSALILAGAGSGKTRVLTTRIAWLLQTGQSSQGGLMAVTFTNKAAKEMLTRLQALVPVPVRGMWVGTFHGLCHRFLRAHWKVAQLPQGFQILDSSDQISAVKRIVKSLQLDEQRFVPKQVSGFISSQKEEGLRPKDVIAHDPHTRSLVQIYEAYEVQCAREGVVDFSELLLRTYEVLRDQPPLRAHYQQRFKHVLVDEFQDTNKLQYLWLKMFCSPQTAVLAVGDDDQSIYAFRGAVVENMQHFEREFNVQHRIKLERNYRSCGHILDTANHLISHNQNRMGKNLVTDIGDGELVRIFEATSDYAEAQWLVDEVKQLQRDGLRLHEIAWLYRSNAQSRVLESALFNASVPYKVYGGLRFFERAEIKHALSYLRLIENPDDDTSFLRVANFPARGIGARTLEQVQDLARQHNLSLYQAVPQLEGKTAQKVMAFVTLIEQLRQQTQGMTLRDIIEQMLQSSGLVEHYRAEREGQDRIENLEELVNAAEAFVTQEGFGRDAVALPVDETLAGLQPDELGEVMSPLAAFLTHAALEAGDNQARTGEDAIQLMTIHAAKGLEFDAVFISGLEEGLFPHENSLSDYRGLEEERRLMYVALTRARKRLYLSCSQTRMIHGQTRYNLKSRFFDELPEGCLKWITPPKQGFGSSYAASYQSAWSKGQGLGSVVGMGSVSPVKAGSGEAQGLLTGQNVFHTKFGEGVILLLEGAGEDARAQVKFVRHGIKWLALSVAKLTPVQA
jgi:DNA helicase II / ATP-dependent DNA helicase PcrA